MTGRRTLLVVASILLAAIGTSLVWLYVQGAETRARDEVQASVELRPVYVTTVDLAAGAILSAGQTKTDQVPVDLAADAVTPQQVAGQTLRLPVTTGTILRGSMFLSGAVSGVDDGKEAVSITIAAPQRVPATLIKGDDVSIYAYAGGQNPDLVVRHVIVQTIGPGPASAGVDQTIVGFEAQPDVVRAIVGLVASGRTPLLVINGKGAQPQG